MPQEGWLYVVLLLLLITTSVTTTITTTTTTTTMRNVQRVVEGLRCRCAGWFAMGFVECTLHRL